MSGFRAIGTERALGSPMTPVVSSASEPVALGETMSPFVAAVWALAEARDWPYLTALAVFEARS